MNERVIKITIYTDIDSLKKIILEKLNLEDHNKDVVAEFSDRLKDYINRNQNLKIVLQFNKERLEKELKFKMELENIVPQPYPDNFEMGNPNNRWLFNTTPKTADEIEKKEFEFETNFQDRLKTFYNFLDSIRQLKEQQIFIKHT